MDLGLKGKVALVTAASRGLGAATALAFGREAARVSEDCADHRVEFSHCARPSRQSLQSHQASGGGSPVAAHYLYTRPRCSTIARFTASGSSGPALR